MIPQRRHTHENEGDGQYIKERQVKKYVHPSGTLYIDISQIFKITHKGQYMNARGKLIRQMSKKCEKIYGTQISMSQQV